MPYTTYLRPARMSRLFLVLFLLLPFTFLLAPTLIAQGNPESSWSSNPISRPAMIYQPPLEADDLSDFLPPDYTYINTTANLTATDPVTVTLPESGGGLLFAEQQVAVIVEDPTFNQATNFSFNDVPVPVYPVTTTNTISNPAHTRTLLSFQLETSEAATGQPISSFEHPVRLVVDLRGLTAELNPVYSHFWLAYRDSEDPNVWTEVPITVHQSEGLISAEVNHFSEWASGVRPQRWNPSWNPPAVSEFSGAATFSYPLELPPGRHGLQPSVALSYSSRGIDGRIQDGEPGAVADGWSMAEISIVRVDVRLKQTPGWPYPRAQMNHRFRLVLDGTGYELIAGGSGAKWGGTRYYAIDAPDLYIELHNITTTQNPPDPSRQRLYWSVVTADGMYYRLGFQPEAEESQQVAQPWFMVLDGNTTNPPIQNPTRAGIAWHIDLMVDSFGNRMTYNYYTGTETENIDYYDNGWHNYPLTTYKNRIKYINYNYQGQTTSLPPSPSTLYPTGIPGSRVTFHARNVVEGQQAGATISNIFIYHGDLSNPIKEYRLVVLAQPESSNACRNENPVPSVPRVTRTYRLLQIQLHVATNSDLNDDDYDGRFALPAVTFSYTAKPHFKEGGGLYPCFSFHYLTGYQNGYGGSVTFTYASDNRQQGNYTTPNESCNTTTHEPPYTYPLDCWLPYGQYEWPEIGHNYFVTSVTQNDGRNPATTTTYSYYKPCYHQKSWTKFGDLPNPPNPPPLDGAHRCSVLPGSDDFLPEVGNILGFQQTTVTQKGFANENLGRRVTTFSQHFQTMGQVTESNSYAWNGTLSQFQLAHKTLNTHTIENLDPSPRYFSYVSESRAYQYDPNNINNYLATRQLNQYNTAYQGGQQWGRLTEQQLYYWANSGWVFQHKQAIRYHTNIDNNHWRILPYSQGLHESGGTTKQLTLLYYDFAINNPETKTLGPGRLTLSRSVLINSPIPNQSNKWYTSDTLMDYDSFGNVTTVKSNSAYGQVGHSGGWNYSVLPGTSTEQTTSISYEPTYNLYPISVTQAGVAGTGDDLTTTFQIYGFNGVALDGWQKQRGLLKQVTNPNGTLVIYEYDPFGRLVGTYENSLDRGNIDQYLDGNPLIRYRYWDNGWNQSRLQGGQFIPIVYLHPENNDPFMITSQTRPGSFNATNPGYEFRSQTFFDGLGRVIQEQNTYQEVHDPVAGTTLQKDVVTTTRYNALGLSDCQTVPYPVALYDQRAIFPANPYVPGNCTNYSRTITTYDNLARPLTVTSPGGAVTSYKYAITSHITASGHTRLQRIQTIDALNHIVSQFTNSLGQLVLVREITGNDGTEGAYAPYADTRYNYDMQGNLVNVGTSVPNDVSITNWLRLSTMTYDAFGRKLTMDDPDMGNWNYSYDALGNLTRQTDAKTNRLCFYYDSHNRFDKKYHNGTGNTACPTTPAGTLLADTDYYGPNQGGATGQVQTNKWPNISNQDSFTYDSQGRLASQTRTIDGRSYTVTTLTWDKLNRPLTVRTPHWLGSAYEVITLSYDHEGENILKAGTDELVKDVKYNVRGQMTFLDRKSSFDSTYTYWGLTDNPGTGNNNGRLYTIQHGAGDDTRPDFQYFYDKVGNISQLQTWVKPGSTQLIDTQNFTYDALNRLGSAIGSGSNPAMPSYNHTYTYANDTHHNGLLGNMTSYAGSSYDYDNWHSNCGTPPQQDLPHAVHKIGTSDYFCYDGNGNMTTRKMGAVTYTQTFDVENRLTQVTQSNNSTVTSFSYDAGGQRTKTEVRPDTNHWTVTYYPFPFYEEEIRKEYRLCSSANAGLGEELGLAPNPYCWVTTAEVKRSTYHLAGQAIATRITGDPVPGNNGLFYFLVDHLGSTSLMISAAATIMSTAYFLPYGGYRSTPPPGELTDTGFTGHKHQDNVGLIYMNARFYIHYLNRFISADTIVPDPTNPQSLNRYSYVRNNPLNFTDPTGHRECSEDTCQNISPYQRALLAAWNYYQANFTLPFEGSPTFQRGVSSNHDGIDWSGNFTVGAPASGTVTKSDNDSPAGMWRIGQILRDGDGNRIGIGEVREWSVFSTCTEGNSCRLYARGDEGLLEPQRLLATGDWEDLQPGWSHTQGTVIEIDHGHNLETVYYHTNPSVEAGTTVNQGDELGVTANNGWSSGTHLHYTLLWYYNPFDQNEANGRVITLNPLSPPRVIQGLLP